MRYALNMFSSRMLGTETGSVDDADNLVWRAANRAGARAWTHHGRAVDARMIHRRCEPGVVCSGAAYRDRNGGLMREIMSTHARRSNSRSNCCAFSRRISSRRRDKSLI